MKNINFLSVVKGISQAFILATLVLCFPVFAHGIDVPTISTQIDPLDKWYFRTVTEDLRGIAYGNGLFVSVGDIGTINISIDGIHWTLLRTTERSPWLPNLTGITYSNRIFMAVGESGTILTSTDGITWAGRNSGVSCNLKGVTYGNGLFVAVGDEGNIVTSPDGISWSQRHTGTDYYFSGIAYGNGVFVAVGFSGQVVGPPPPSTLPTCCHMEFDYPAAICYKSIILTSHDGMSWTENSLLTNCYLTGVTFGNGTFVAVGDGPTLTSSDGITWTESDSLGNFNVGNFNSITYLDDTFVAVGDGVIFTSSDGVKWTSRSLGGDSLYGITYGNDTFVAVGEHSNILTSPDAQNWTNRTLGIAVDVIYVNSTFVAVASMVSSGILSSPDGVIWTRKDLGISGGLEGITYGNGAFVAVGDGIILTSTDGVNWTKSSSTFSGYLRSVSYGNNTFVAVGSGKDAKDNWYGIISTSSDGVNWTETDLEAVYGLSRVTYGNGMFVAVGGYNGSNGHAIILTSADAVNWETSRISGTKGGLTGVTFGKDLFVAVGDSSLIVISNDGLSWTIIGTPGDYGDLGWVAYGNGTFVATRRSDLIITSTDGINWTRRTAGPYDNLHGLTYGNGTFLAVGESIIQSDPVSSSKYTLTVIKPRKGNGTITSSPAGIDCGSDCTGMYNVGSVVTLVATPSAGSIFTGWSGGCSGIDTTCTITITSGPNFVMANFFTEIPETISTPNTPSGPTNGITGTSYSFSTGGSSSNMGHSIEYRFNWGDGTNSGWLPVSQTSASKSWASAGTYSVKAQARCATDTFAVSGWSSVLSVTISAAETVSTPSILSGPTSGFIGISYSYTTGGSTSTLGHDVQYIFDWGDGTNSGWLPVGQTSASKSWSFAGTYALKARGRCATHMDVVSFWSGSLSVTITQGYSLTTSVNPQEGGSVSPAGANWYNSGQTVQVLATANPGYTFTNWSGDFIGTANPITITINANKTVTAHFAKIPETVSTPMTPSGPTSGTTGTPYSYTTGGSISSFGHSVEYQFDWKGDGSDLSPWGAATQSKIWTAAGTYNVRARARCTIDTSVMSDWSGSIQVAIASSRSTRTLPRYYTPSLPLTVAIAINPGTGVQAYSAEDSPPNGWTVSNINENGQWDDVNKKVKWGVFFDNNPRTLTYQVTPPVGETGVKSFLGKASFDGVNEVIGGDSRIELGALLHPADTSLNFELSINEVTAYAAAWRSGQTWPVPPNPIPIEYPTNAAYLWRNGEAYHYDGTQIPPSCWVPGAATGSLSVSRSLFLKDQTSPKTPVTLSTGTATRDLPNCYTPSAAMSISIAVTPGQGTQVYAVEDSPPSGWTVSEINESGGWDNVKKKVKWGPFFDSNNRTLTYKVTPPSDESGAKTFSGTASFDGTNVAIGGDLTVGDCSTSIIILQSPFDKTAYDTCSLYSLPVFSWTVMESFKGYEIQFSLDSDFISPIKVRASGTQSTITSATWKKVLLLPGNDGGTVYWRVVGTRANRTTFTSEVRSIIVEPSEPVGTPTISPTSKTSLPELSWQNNCNTKFKVWFGSDESFNKKNGYSFNIRNPNDNGGILTKVLTSGQWKAIRKLVGDVSGPTIYWYVESWDGLNRYAKTEMMSFTLLP